MPKTSKCTRKAISKYQANKDRITLLLPKGTKDILRARYGKNININKYIRDLINNDLLDLYTINTDSIIINTDNQDTELF